MTKRAVLTLTVGMVGKNESEIQKLKITEKKLLAFCRENGIAIDVKKQTRVQIGDSDYSTDGRDIYYKTTAISLTQTEYNFMEPLINQPGKSMSFEGIEKNGEYESSGDYHTDEQFLYRIRKKFEVAVGREGKKILSRSKGKLKFNINV